MPFACRSRHCATPCWMGKVLVAAGIYHIGFAIWSNLLPNQWFDWIGLARPNHPLMWHGAGLVAGILGIALILASRDPVKHWIPVLLGLLKFSLGIAAFTLCFFEKEISLGCIWMMFIDDLVWWPPFAAILWATVRAHAGVPPTRSEPFTIEEASEAYRLSNGKSLAAASREGTLALVFMRHFGCTFTRQILRGLEGIERDARAHGADLVLVHMLQSGQEYEYLGNPSGVLRISDPRCELYRAFGLGKGGFMELFGPRVWWRMAISLYKGCGVGHLAGDGLQMPGAFLFKDGKIISAQPARSASDLPDLPSLFQGLPLPIRRETVEA